MVKFSTKYSSWGAETSGIAGSYSQVRCLSTTHPDPNPCLQTDPWLAGNRWFTKVKRIKDLQSICFSVRCGNFPSFWSWILFILASEFKWFRLHTVTVHTWTINILIYSLVRGLKEIPIQEMRWITPDPEKPLNQPHSWLFLISPILLEQLVDAFTFRHKIEVC